jgi:FlaA1/EpsC-like NDP-sugar epimerase
MAKSPKAINKKIMIIGAGEAGTMVIKQLKRHTELVCMPVVLIDDDIKKRNAVINGVTVKGDRNRIKHIAEKNKIDEIIVAIPSADRIEISDILHLCNETKCSIKVLPSVYESIDEKVNIKHLRDIKIEDLLGRQEIKLNNKEIVGYIQGEVVLITGGGGSIGSELCRQVAKYNPKGLIVIDINKQNAYALQNELWQEYKDGLNLRVIIASTRDRKPLEEIFRRHKPGVVFQAATRPNACLLESDSAEAIKNNLEETLNVAQCAHKFGAKKFVLISTDKAINPTNIMDVSNRVAEMIVQSLDENSNTKFVAVRHGNVLDGNGGVIPLIRRQIEQGGPVTVTHPNITRYLMTISETAKLTIQAGAIAQGGEILILDMGESVNIDNLARNIIRLSGFIPDVDIKVEYTGLRPREKLYKELLLAEEGLKTTSHPYIFVGKPMELSHGETMQCINSLINSLDNYEQLRDCIKRVVPTYLCLGRHDEVAISE